MSTRPSSTPIYDTELGGTIVIPAKLTTIDPYAFYDTKLSHKLLAKVSCKSKWKGFKLFTPTSRKLFTPTVCVKRGEDPYPGARDSRYFLP